MTRNRPRITAGRMLMTLAPAVFVAAAAVGFVGGSPTVEASAGEKSGVAAEVSPACLTDDLTGIVMGLPRRAESSERAAVLRLTNTSGRACQVPGWADIALVTPPGELVRVPTRKAGQAGGAAVVLKPRADAWSKVEWDGCDVGGKGCGAGVALQFIVDPDSAGSVADTIAVPEADQAGIAMTAMRIGPLRQTRTEALG
ncbi:DUF4232 domain-containing protein [Actinoplanes sp. GCM10030250]|uniref:DUF4232 domain-containing protein n=1 Tax=Actinoplanes sp. GCM10030250 TaxID=3273376 RepID=UPI00361E8B5B